MHSTLTLTLTHLRHPHPPLYHLLFLLALIHTSMSTCPSEAAGGVLVSSLGVSGGAFEVPSGASYVFDLETSPNFEDISVRGTLILADFGKPIEIIARSITVFDGGEFVGGSCDCPFMSKATVTLTGAASSSDPNGVGTKVIGVRSGGKLSLYGEVRGPTWTFLESTVDAGSNTITLQQEVDWTIGDEIIVVSSGFPEHDWSMDPVGIKNEETEVKVISSISGRTITLTTPLVYEHLGITVDNVNLRAEVGLLTRNIVVQGDASSDASKFGAHLMFLSGSLIKLVGVEVVRGGQFGFLGRYPIHFHLFGDASESIVDSCSIHHSYQRCLTLHGVDNLRVFHNVAYLTTGHCFFMEDGIEKKNVIAHNLAVHVLPTNNGLLPSDKEPALYWITNPTNHFIGNAAVSSPEHCYWMAPPIFPLGPSHTKDYSPIIAPLGTFSHNFAHGCIQNGFHADDTPDRNGCTTCEDDWNYRTVTTINEEGGSEQLTFRHEWNPYNGNPSNFKGGGTTVAKFVSFTAWRCRQHGLWFDGGPFVVEFAHLADNTIGITDDMHNDFGRVLYSNFVGKATQSWRTDEHGSQQRGLEFYAGAFEAIDNVFSRYEPEAGFARSAMGTFRGNRFTISVLDGVAGFKALDNTRPFYSPSQVHSGEQSFGIKDRDGSLTGRPPPNGDVNHCAVVVPPLPHLKTSSCVDMPEWNAQICPNHFVSVSFRQSNVASRASQSEANFAGGTWKLTRADDVGTPYVVCGEWCDDETHDVNPSANSGELQMALFRHYYLHWLGPATASSFTVRLNHQPMTVNENKSAPYNELLLSVCFPQGSVVGQVLWNWRSNVAEASSLDQLKNGPVDLWGGGMWFHEASTGYVHLRMVMMDHVYEIPPIEDYINSNAYVVITMSSLGVGGRGSCSTPAEASTADVHKVVPPLASVPSPAPFPPEPLPPSIRYDMCEGGPPPVHCVVSMWGAWSECLGECGGVGSRSRSRTVEVEASNGGSPCPVLSESDSGCSTATCKVDCLVSEWSDWDMCSVECGGGTQARSRQVLTQPSGGGSSCPPSSSLTEMRSCGEGECVVDCVVSEWSGWSICNVECGAGSQSRTRAITTLSSPSGIPCPSQEELSEVQMCEMAPCVVNCILSDWTTYSSCDASCGGGTQARTCIVVTPASGGGDPCPLPELLTDSIVCNSQPCPINCEVSQWSGFTACTVECGGGLQSRTREVLSQPQHNGTSCPMLSEETSCNIDVCVATSVDCTWNEWTFGECSVSCGDGTLTRTRTSNAPQNGGASCSGNGEETLPCNLGECNSPVNCLWDQWSSWSDCTVACGTGGSHVRTRGFNPPSSANGSPCLGPSSEQQVCNDHDCAIECRVSEWSIYTGCSLPCGTGTKSRSRQIIVSPSAGLTCPSLFESQSCNTDPCSSPSTFTPSATTTPSPTPTPTTSTQLPPTPCYSSDWTGWAICTVAGDGACDASVDGVQTRSRLLCDNSESFQSQSCLLDCSISPTTTPSPFAPSATADSSSGGFSPSNNIMEDEAAGIPVWAWIVIGVTSLLVLIGVIGITIYLKSRSPSGQYDFY